MRKTLVVIKHSNPSDAATVILKKYPLADLGGAKSRLFIRLPSGDTCGKMIEALCFVAYILAGDKQANQSGDFEYCDRIKEM